MPGPVAFGQYEIGRSRMGGHDRRARQGSPWALSGTKGAGRAYLGGNHIAVGTGEDYRGDPGRYAPERKAVSFGASPSGYAGFGSRAPRATAATEHAERSPGPAAYSPGAGQTPKPKGPQHGPAVTGFRSGSLQRPSSATGVPGPQRYRPDLNSIKPRNAGDFIKYTTPLCCAVCVWCRRHI